MREPSVGTIYLLKRAELAVRSCMEVSLEKFDLTPAQFLMLFRLRDRPEISAAELAREIGIRPQSIMEIIRPLERKCLLKREASPANRSILQTRLTAAGLRLLVIALGDAARIEAELLAQVTEEQLATLQDVLSKLLDRAEKHELHPSTVRARTDALMREHGAPRQRHRVSRAIRRVRTS